MKRAILLLVAIFFICSGSLFTCNGGNDTPPPTPDPPIPPTPDPVTITGITIDWTTKIKKAIGSDNFPVTWSNDGHQYTSWGDGFGFQGGSKRSLGFSRISGEYNAQTYQDLWSGDGKCYGIIEVGGALYAWVGEYGSGTSAWENSRLYLSTDKGLTWARNSWAFSKAHRIFALTFLQAGKDYADAQDNNIYIYAPYMQKEKWQVQKPGKIMLMRVPKDKILDILAYEYFAASHWSTNIADMVPCLVDNQGVFQTSVIYFKDLNKYVLTTEHTEFGKGNMVMYQADSPWGPWTAFYRTSGFGGTTFFWNFSAAWSKGKDFALIYTGIGNQDAYQCVKVSFVTE